mgnify:CR=1 FL=1
MFELFVIGTFWWALIVAELVLLFIFIENENGVGATVSLIIFAACLQWLGKRRFDWIRVGEPVGNPSGDCGLLLNRCYLGYY